MALKKIINRPADFVDELTESLLLAHPDRLRAASEDRRALVRADAPVPGEVGIVTGGGSGHLPLFLGYVGEGLAHGVAVGNVFSSPSAEQIAAATRACDGGAGVLYLYGNYGGDIYNFDLAADIVAADGIRTATVLGTDDVLSAPPGKEDTRRGVAGLFFAYKTAGAAARRGDPLEGVREIAQRTVDRTRTMGVGLSPTILPAAGEPTFTLDEGEMEVGIGIHGEPGSHRGPLETADEITDRFLTEILGELRPSTGDRVAVLVNGLGATPLEELYLIYRRAHQVLTERGVRIHRTYIGEFATSLEMAGASLSVLLLDDELAGLVDAPAASPFFSQGAAAPSRPDRDAPRQGTAPVTRSSSGQKDGPRRTGRPSRLRAVLPAVLADLPGHAEELRALDARLGDGDLGITVSSGAAAAREALLALPEDVHPGDALRAAGTAFASANPSTFAALVGSGLLAAAAEADETADASPAGVARIVATLARRVQERGGARLGDKTFLDVLEPVRQTLTEAAEGASPLEVADAVVSAAARAVEETAGLTSARGRAAWVGDRSAGERDPGSVAVLRFVETLRAHLG
ncbi:dihydroxyacetone kinase family protein [Marinactinospora thermotolerans]|uniref:Homodimeric dihydroxyacetone kinase n=1 Tax=Marinactinospora thermotolerans DSM 45154 TaxID=1122192 RepID=A0A1T4K789_9ACTN|nr:dihydroxyacetone kinase family protein [Marinactinospora thermotolerans]SJZ38279.1 homodimeric dihydroxyacetone kinase [Marinactinospora thermotolerans DSM 45154]